MQPTEQMPLATLAYPSEHPYPIAVRRVNQLEQLLLSGVIVHLHELTRYSSTGKGMVPDEKGGWVTLVDVMGQSRATHADDEAAARFTGKVLKRLAIARKAGRYGWDTPNCNDADLARSMTHNLAIGDLVDVAVYAMMLDARGASTDVIRKALETHLATNDADSQATVTFGKYLSGYRPGDEGWDDADRSAYMAALRVQPMHYKFSTPTQSTAGKEAQRDAAEAFAQALIAQGWHNGSETCVEGVEELLGAFLAAHREVPV